MPLGTIAACRVRQHPENRNSFHESHGRDDSGYLSLLRDDGRACNWDEESLEPPVPADLAKLPPELAELIDFDELDCDSIAAANVQSPKLPRQAARELEVDDWLSANLLRRNLVDSRKLSEPCHEVVVMYCARDASSYRFQRNY